IAGRLEQQGRLHPNETTSSMAALNVIAYYEGCSNGALSQVLGLSHAATVRLVDKLEAANLVISEQGTDKRAVALRLTDLGRERAAAAGEASEVAGVGIFVRRSRTEGSYG